MTSTEVLIHAKNMPGTCLAHARNWSMPEISLELLRYFDTLPTHYLFSHSTALWQTWSRLRFVPPLVLQSAAPSAARSPSNVETSTGLPETKVKGLVALEVRWLRRKSMTE